MGPPGERFEDGAPARLGEMGAEVRMPEIVHVDRRRRVVTFRPNGNRMEASYYISVDRYGQQTGAVKLAPVDPASALRTADILEGGPEINNRIIPADPATRNRLAELYPDPETSIE
jgi:hypothetical protein